MPTNVFDELGDIIKKLPEEADKAVREATQEAVDEYGKKMFEYLKAHCGNHLRAKILPPDKNWSKNGYLYIYSVDWSDELVNPNRKYTNPPPKRARGKRDYSKNPATWHDLAWILSVGRTIVKDNGDVVIVPPKNFIAQGVRRKNGWQTKQQKLFAMKLADIAKELT